MEDVLHFCESFEAAVFLRGTVLPELLQEMWDHLVAAVSHYLRPAHGGANSSPEARAAAAEHLRMYGELMERHAFPDKMFTFNLHMLVCRSVVPHTCGHMCFWVHK